MKAHIKNRKTVAEAMTKARMAGKNPDECFAKQVGSRAMFYRGEELTVKSSERKEPSAKFSKVDLGGGAFIWAPTNTAGQNYLSSLSVEERDKFLYHQPSAPTPTSDKPESHRVVDGRPIKGLPRGHREGECYAEDGSYIKDRPKKLRVATHTSGIVDTDRRPTEEPNEDYIASLRAAISAGTF